MYRNIIFILFFYCLLAGCLPSSYYQKEVAVPGSDWDYNYKPVFSFDITDTTAAYRTFFLIQHTQAYPFSNLWLLVYIKKPGDSVAQRERLNIPLAEANGKWLGRSVGEIWEQRLQMDLGDSVVFNKKGTYQISLEQNMRINPLPEILHVGLRVEKYGHRNVKKQ